MHATHPIKAAELYIIIYLLVKFDPTTFVADPPHLAQATHFDGTLDDDGGDTEEDDDGLEGVRPQHRFHPTLNRS